jgi:hypothetical protein
MAGYPTTKVHRPSRRKLGKGQYPASVSVGVTVTSSGTTNVTLTFSQPVVVRGTIGVTVAGKTLVSQTIVSPTEVTQVWSGNVTGLAYTVPSADPHVSGQLGGQLVGSAGTFP